MAPSRSAGDLAALDRLAAALRDSLGGDAVRARVPLSRYTTVRVGGPADLLVEARTLDALRLAVSLGRGSGVPCRVLGSGSNILVADKGFRGLVVVNRARGISVVDTLVTAESGTALAALSRRCVARGLAGLEWAEGIPGTVGGAVVCNAGAWGGDVASALLSACVLEADGMSREWPAARFEYGYRTSALKRAGAGAAPTIVLSARFALQQAASGLLRSRVAEIRTRRRETQPAGFSCGSVFKNPPGDHAGRLIEAAGLKGRRCGEAEISPVHANFFVNNGRATATDLKTLIDIAARTVEEHFGLSMELEIELLGEW